MWAVRPLTYTAGASSAVVGAALAYDYNNMSPMRKARGWTLESATMNLNNKFPPKQEYDMIGLAKHNGKEFPACFAAGGVVWDVSTSDFFSDGGPYAHFSGRDCTLALARMQLGASWVNQMDNWKKLDEKDQGALDSWIRYFDEKYPRVGVLREWTRDENYVKMQERFLENNAKRPTVTVLPSGLQFEILKTGLGLTVESDDTKVVIHNRGCRIDGVVFGDSYAGEPMTVTPQSLIPGLAEGLLHMREGERRKLFVPACMGYGNDGQGDVIWPSSCLVFELELLRIDVVTEDLRRHPSES